MNATKISSGYYRYRGYEVFLENEQPGYIGRWMIGRGEGGEFTSDYATKREAMAAIDQTLAEMNISGSDDVAPDPANGTYECEFDGAACSRCELLEPQHDCKPLWGHLT